MRILAVASGGGHWVQLMRLKPALEGHDTIYVTTHPGYARDVQGIFHTVTDANMWQKFRLFRMSLEMAYVVIRERPQIVITTGAAPGFAAIVLGKLTGARTLWLDSIANSEELSQSGKLASRIADVWLTQWEHLERPEGPNYWGAVL